MNDKAYRTRSLVIICLLALANWGQTLLWSKAHKQELRLLATLETCNAASKRMNIETDALQTNSVALVKKANKIGFVAALYGYEARRQGMEPEAFVIQAASIFGTTNLPEVSIEIGTNKDVDIRAFKESRRL